MIRFQIFGFPVVVHWAFWLITALLGGAANATSPDGLKRVLIWVAVAFVSILWHELGHAFVMRHFGDRRTSILLYGGGGLASGSAFRTRREQILISFAGPAAGLALGGLVFWIDAAFPMHSPYARLIVRDLLWINIAWSLVNLLPIIPLDGGRISEAALAHKGRLALQISLICAAAVAVYAFTQWGSIFMGLMFAAMAVDNWRAMNGQAPTGWMGQ
jgi:stage IV sporulation protein FB